MIEKKEYEIKLFKTQKDFEDWMAKNFDKVDGIWLKIYKKASGKQSVNYNEALDVALCYGWIDGIVNRMDEEAYKQKFTPRRSKSIWSKINRDNIQRLTDEGRMKPAGLKQVEEAKADGRWDAAYDSPANAKPPKEFIEALAKNKKAKEFYESLNKTNQYAVIWRLQTAKKPETKDRWIKKIIEMLAKGEKFH